VPRYRQELEEFCAAAYPRLVGALALHCGDRHLAEDLAQEALIRACRDWRRVRTLQSPIGWAYRAGANLSTSQARRRSAEHRALRRVVEQDSSRRGAQDVDLALDVGDALARLSDGHRVVVLLRYQLGLTAVEAAQTLDSTPAAVRALTHRALVALRAHLDFDADDLRPEARRVP
jgi:RNA polymerase sigma factor (sigma-70 family)